MGKGWGLHPKPRRGGGREHWPGAGDEPSLGSGGREDLGLHGASAGAWVHPGGAYWGAARAGGDQNFSWLRGRHTHCAWGAPGAALLQEASFSKLLQDTPAQVQLAGAARGQQRLAPLGCSLDHLRSCLQTHHDSSEPHSGRVFLSIAPLEASRPSWNRHKGHHSQGCSGEGLGWCLPGQGE